jgi:glycosyltransferase involved in cell wall biosynthesis
MAFNSGIGVYLRNILTELASRDQARFQIFAYEGDIAELKFSDNLFFTPMSSPIYSFGEHLEIFRKINPQAQVLWTPHYNMPLLTHRKRLVTIHDVAHLAEPTINHRLIPRIYAYIMLSSVRLFANHILFVSHFSEQEFSRVIGKPRSKTSITKNAVGSSWRSNERLSSNRDPLTPRRYIVFVGNVKPHKNLGGLLRAFASIVEHCDIDLVIVGKRDGFIFDDPGLEALVIRIQDRVIFTGPLPEVDLIATVRDAAALVLPSFYEGFGIPPLEAMSVGTPTIVSDIPALRETCGDASLYFNPYSPQDMASSILSLINDPNLSAALAKKGRERCVEFSFQKSADVVMATLLSLGG